MYIPALIYWICVVLYCAQHQKSIKLIVSFDLFALCLKEIDVIVLECHKNTNITLDFA